MDTQGSSSNTTNYSPCMLWSQTKKTNLLPIGFSPPSRKLNSPPKYFQSSQNKFKNHYFGISHQNSHSTSPLLGKQIWQNHDPRQNGCRHTKVFSLKLFMQLITWMSLTHSESLTARRRHSYRATSPALCCAVAGTTTLLKTQRAEVCGKLANLRHELGLWAHKSLCLLEGLGPPTY